MPSQQAQQLQEFADEIFEMSKEIWAAQTRAKTKEQPELTETEFLALDILHKAGQSQTVGEIQRTIGILPAQMSRVIRSLESKSDEPLIACRINPTDKRKVDVELTAAGRKAHTGYRQMKLGHILAMLESLETTDRQEFIRILRLIRHKTNHAKELQD